MLATILDVISGVSKSGNHYTQAALRCTGRNGDFLTVAKCPPDWLGRNGEIVECTVSFGSNGGGNLVVPF